MKIDNKKDIYYEINQNILVRVDIALKGNVLKRELKGFLLK